MFGTWRTRYWFLLLSAGCLLLASFWQGRLVTERNRHGLVVQASAEDGVPPEYILTGSLLGGFRGLFVAMLWQRAQNMKQDGEFYEMVDLYNIITKLQPGHHQSWAFQAWDLAYNVSVEHKNLGDRPFWVFRGIDLLRRQGIPNSPRIPELYSELAWIFHHKIGGDQDFAFPYYRAALAGQTIGLLELNADAPEQLERIMAVADLPATRAELVTRPAVRAAVSAFEAEGKDLFAEELRPYLFRAEDAPAPYPPEAMEGVREVWLWAIGQRLRDRMGMDPVVMRNLLNVYGPIDWRTPYAHALYWAQEGYDVWWGLRPEKPDLKYARLVYFSLIQLTERGRLVWGEGMQPFYLPDYSKYEAVIRHMDQTMNRFREWSDASGHFVPLTGFRAGYTHFLRRGVFHAYFMKNTILAERLLAKLREEALEKEEYELTPAQFVAANFGEWASDASTSKVGQLLFDWSSQSFLALALGQENDYTGQKNLAEAYYEGYVRPRWPSDAPTKQGADASWQGHVPTLVSIRAQALWGALTGQTGLGLNDAMKLRLVSEARRREPEVWRVVDANLQYMRQQAEQGMGPAGPEQP